MPGGKRRRPFTPVDTNPTSIRIMLLGLEMADRVDQSFVKVQFHRMTTEYSNWLADKIADKEADKVAMKSSFSETTEKDMMMTTTNLKERTKMTKYLD